MHAIINSNKAISNEEISVAHSINNSKDDNSGLNISFEYVNVSNDVVMIDSTATSSLTEPASALLIDNQACIKPFINIGMTFLYLLYTITQNHYENVLFYFMFYFHF